MAKKKSGSGKSAKKSRERKSSGPGLPGLLDAFGGSHDVPDLRALIGEKSFQQFLQHAFDGQLSDMVERGDSPMDRALDLLDEAEYESPAKQAQLARKAIKICPDCSEAHVLLGDLVESEDEALVHYREAVAAGWRALGKNPRKEYGDHFWLALETRPFMSAKMNLARNLWGCGQVAEAISHYQEMLELNPNDNQGARHELANCLLREDRRADLTELLARYPKDGSPEMRYAAALLAFREEGNTPRSRKLLREAKKSNKHVLNYLVGGKAIPEELPDYISPGRDDEASAYAAGNLRNWSETDGAIPWVRQVFKLKVLEPSKAKKRPSAVMRWQHAAAELPQDGSEVWQVDVAPMLEFVEDAPDLAPWMTAIVREEDAAMVNFDMLPEQPTADEALSFVLQTMTQDERREPARPAAIEVRSKELYEAWRPICETLEIELLLCKSLPACEAAMEESSRASDLAGLASSVLRDAAAGELPSPDTLPQQVGESWIADVRPLPTWFEDEGTMIRPMMSMVIDDSNQALLMQDMAIERDADEELLWRVLLAAMAGPQDGDPRRPARIGFRTAELVERFGPRLAEFNIVAEVVGQLDAIDFMADELGRRMSGPDLPPALVDVPGITSERMRAFFQAAALFRKKAVWRQVPSDAILRVDRIAPEGPSWFGAVMGQSGMTYGLALYESLEDLLALMSGQIQAHEDAIKISSLSMTFGEAFDISPRDLDAQQREGWPVAGNEGYPNVVRVNPGGSMRPPLAWELDLISACLVGLPGFMYRPGANSTATCRIDGAEVTVRLNWLDEIEG